jgi:CubicO group peptidase (beta-lactamase class C family)
MGLFLILVIVFGGVVVFSERGIGNQLQEKEPYYFPERWEWKKKKPEDAGMDAQKIKEAVDFSIANEGKAHSREMKEQLAMILAGEPYNEIIGPTKARGGVNGLIIRHGYIVAEWGDTRRVDMTFSASKSYLATMAGVALDEGLIRSFSDPVLEYVQDGTFELEQNNSITWHHLLNQTSEWQGTLFDKPDWADRFNGKKRPYNEPGTVWTYNDVRVNLLGYALLQVLRTPLPQVLRERIMDPIGASSTWRWHGYRNSYMLIDGVNMQSVSGGGHWGGGVWINSHDHARFGYLHLRRGRWKGRQLISENWIDAATTPTPVKPVYGYMWWLNTGREMFPSAPASSFFALGGGTNMVWVDPENDLVVVVRWIENDKIDEFIKLVLAAVS